MKLQNRISADIQDTISRRRFLSGCAVVASGLIAPSWVAAAVRSETRSLAFRHLHTGERLTATYWADGEYLDGGLQEISQLLRDHRTGDALAIDRDLLDLLHTLKTGLGSNRSFRIISGYRSPHTNAMLRGKSGKSGVAKRSLHMQGKAIDVRLPGTELHNLRKAALALKGGGVGYYPKSDFVHLDTGRVRFW